MGALKVSALWNDVREALMRVLDTREPHVSFEDKVIIAEDAARQVVGDVEWLEWRSEDEHSNLVP